MPAAELLRAHAATVDPYIGRGSCYMGPVLDERTLTRHPFYPDAPPQSAGIPMMIGNTHDETRSLIGRGDPGAFDLTWEALPQRLEAELRVDISGATGGRRISPAVSALFAGGCVLRGDHRRTLLARAPSSRRNCAPRRARRPLPTSSTGARPQDGGKWGAFHTLDIPLMFGTLTAREIADRRRRGGAARVGNHAAGAAGFRAHRRS